MLKRYLIVGMVVCGLAIVLYALTARTETRPASAQDDCVTSITVSSELPADVTGELNQANVNCFAWQNFIALNWLADPTQRGLPDAAQTPATFGDITPDRLTVWQTYRLPQDVFLDDAATPPAWNEPDIVPSSCPQAVSEDGTQTVIFTSISKFDVIPEDIQADGHYLVDQTGQLVYYDRRMNETEYDFIINNGLYSLATLQGVAADPGLDLPDGSMETKSAWRILDGLPAEVQARYFQTQAYIAIEEHGDETVPCTEHLLGLIGLHIIVKTPTLPAMLWATFEQVDNYPDTSADTAPFALYNPDCTDCPTNVPPPTGTLPAGSLTPVQAVRLNPIPGSIQSVNASVQDIIRTANPDSVWQHYELINALWFTDTGSVTPGMTGQFPEGTPHAASDDASVPIVANLSMETYVQDSLTCTGCHAYASVATTLCDPTATATPIAALTDFSFVFGLAQCAPVVTPTPDATEEPE